MAWLDELENKEVAKWIDKFKNDVEQYMEYTLLIKNEDGKLKKNFPYEVRLALLIHK